MKKKNSSPQAFTLIELLVVTTIVIVMTAIGLVGFSSANQRSRNSRRQTDMALVRSALELYRAVEGSYPNVSTFSALMSNSQFQNYIQTSTIQDPKNTSPYTYRYNATGGGTGYSLCYVPEPTSSTTCFTNP